MSKEIIIDRYGLGHAVVVLDNGKIVASGKYERLLKTNSLFKKISVR